MDHSAAPLIDIGLNLAHDSFDADRSAVIERAQAAGVVRMIITGSSVASTRSAIAMAREHPDLLKGTAGVHPHHALELDDAQLAELSELARVPQVVAVGECGLDYFRDLAPRPAQREAFRRQLELAAAVRKPVFLHQRDAHEDFLAMLREYRDRLVGGVAHCFTDGTAEAHAYLDLGLHIGITGWICDERRGYHLREVVAQIPADRLLLETDAPYLLPRNIEPKPQGRRNEPMYLPYVCAAVAAARGESAAAVAARTTENAMRLFAWPPATATGEAN